MQNSTHNHLLEKLMQGDLQGYYDTLNQENDAEYKKYYEYDLLLKAIYSNDKNLVIPLLDSGCCLNVPREICRRHNSPLHLAAAKPGWCEIVEKMIKQGACAYVLNEDANTPLHLAFIYAASDKVITLLLDDIFYKYFQKFQDLIDLLNKDGLGVFHIACSKNDEYIVRQLYANNKFDISAQVSPLCGTAYAGYSPLHFAVMYSQHTVARFLCLNRSELYVVSANGSTPLHLALERRDFLMINILCMNDVRYDDFVNDHGTTHFMAVCANCDPKWAKMYLRNERNHLPSMLNARVKDGMNYPNGGYTPLHFACLFGRNEIVDLLLTFHVHLTVANDGLSPFDIVRIRYNVETDKRIKEMYADIYEMFRKHINECKKCEDLVVESDKRLRELEAKSLQEKTVQ